MDWLHWSLAGLLALNTIGWVLMMNAMRWRLDEMDWTLAQMTNLLRDLHMLRGGRKPKKT